MHHDLNIILKSETSKETMKIDEGNRNPLKKNKDKINSKLEYISKLVD